MPLFGKAHKSPTEIVKTLKENLAILVKQEKKMDKVNVCEGVSVTGLCEAAPQNTLLLSTPDTAL